MTVEFGIGGTFLGNNLGDKRSIAPNIVDDQEDETRG